MNKYIFFKVGLQWTKLDKNEIVYIKSSGPSCIIKTTDKEIIVNVKIGLIEDSDFLKDSFIRVHKQYIINVNHLTTISKGYILLEMNRIPIGKSYFVNLVDKLCFVG